MSHTLTSSTAVKKILRSGHVIDHYTNQQVHLIGGAI